MAYTDLPAKNIAPLPSDTGVLTRAVPQNLFRTTFAKVLASTWDTSFWTRIFQGTGQTNSQSSGKGVITSGTTVNSETILRSVSSFTGSFLLRAQTILSQRIANNNFFIELVDVIGDNLAITVNSATSVTITIPSNPFTSENVGQSMYIGALTGFTGVTAIPGRYAIASVSGNDVTFTVASWATGAGNTGTCSLFGWNYHQLLYTGVTATNVNYDTQRRGWNTGFTVANINTTASPGHMAVMGTEDGDAFLSDQLVATATTLPLTRRATRVINIAEETTPLFLQIRCVNGSTAPASTTTWTVGMVSLENYSTQQVTIANAKPQSANTATPVTIENTPTITATNLSTNIAQVGGTNTVNGGVAGILAVGGNVAHSAASTANPLQAGGRVVPTTIATQDASLVAGDVSYLPISTGLQTLTKNFSTAELDYSIQFDSAATTVTVQPLVPASGTASVRNYITGFVVSNDALGTAGIAWVLDSALTVSSIAITTGLVTTSTAHDLKVGDAVTFTALAGGTGVSTNVKYHVTSVGSTTTFNFAATVGGANIVPSVAYTGTTMYRILHQFRFQTGAQQSVNSTIPNPYRGIANTACNFLIPTSLTSGNIYLSVIGYRGF